MLTKLSPSNLTQNLLFIDSKVKDLDQLIAGVKPNTAVYILHPQENGIEQITAILQQHPQLETVYLVAHGEPGCLYLGNDIVTEETLSKVGESLKTWNIKALLIYACNVAEGVKGEAFLQRLHQLTKVKIAAASHAIGQTEFGQNWQLDKTTHPIEIKSVFNAEVMTTYSGVLAAGDLDTSFGGGDGIVGISVPTKDTPYSIAVQSDGKIVMAGDYEGTSSNGSDVRGFEVVRCNSNGTIDTTFNDDLGWTPAGVVMTEIGDAAAAYDVAVQPDGKIVVAGFSDNYATIVRYNINGSLDTTFSGDAIIKTNVGGSRIFRDIAVQTDGKIVAVDNAIIVRYNSNGTLDTTFSGDGIIEQPNFSCNDIAFQPDGKILVSGSSNANFAVARYNSNGTLDTSFSGDGKLTTDLGGNDNIWTMALQPDGKIFVAGRTYNSYSDQKLSAARYNSNGTLDTTFSDDGKLNVDSSFLSPDNIALALQPDGKILVVDDNLNLRLRRYNSNGNLDTTFGGDGQVETEFSNGMYPSAMTVQADGNILVAGMENVVCDFTVVRYMGSSTSSTINGTANNDILTGTANPETINGLVGNDKLSGLAGNDTLNGGDGVDTLDGGAGNDLLKGNAGNDVYIVGTGDIVTELAAQGTDLVQSSISYTLPANVENLTLTGTTAINGTGNGLANTINGNSANNTLNGSTGNDLILGNGGVDKLLGGDGNDSVNGGAGNDTLTGGLGTDKFIYNTNAAFTTSAVGVDTIADFIIAQGDKIVLDKTTFPKISSVAGTGFSLNSEFAKVTTDALAATSAADIVYNSATGALFYNQNGTAAGFGTGGKFLTLTNKPVLTENQFLIQA